jgi:DNA invertase Pin-like site-specific DNA recombinase
MNKVTTHHLGRKAYLYIRQSSLHQVQENRESTARQYDLKRRAIGLGWTGDQIVVIDEDLGLSGTTSERNGFQRLVADVGLGRAGIVMGLEVSRLARNSTDWHRLLEICALSDTLILDEDGIYDPSHFNDRLLLGLKGTMSEAEIHVLKARLLGGQRNKARRGELWMRPPVGFVSDREGKLALDPDRQIQDTVRLLFETFRRTGSAEKVVKHFSAEGVLWPRRLASGELFFIPLEHSRVLQVLHNPRYSGAYVYGRTRQRKGAGGHIRSRKLPREEWEVFFPHVHPGYISWEEFEANQAVLKDNANGYGLDRPKRPAREGSALLQGLVLCGICGRPMSVRYYRRNGHPVPDYVCQRKSIANALSHPCQVVPGTGLDDAIGEVVVEAVSPTSLDVALEVFEEIRARKAEVDRIRRAQVERAREEAEIARRQYMLVRPENRLVADALEGQWNQKLTLLSQAEDDYRTTKEEPSELAAEDRERIQALARDLPRVWRDPRTSARDKKRMLRLLVEDVTLTREAPMLRIDIRWKGGSTVSFTRPLPLSATDLFRTPSPIVEIIRLLAKTETDGDIARILNERKIRPVRGKRFTSGSVAFIRRAYGIESLRQLHRKEGWLTNAEMAKLLGMHPQTTRRFAAEGLLQARKANDRGELLFKPIAGPLPKVQPGKRFKDRPKCASNTPNEVQYEA